MADDTRKRVVVMNFSGMRHSYVSASLTPFLYSLAESIGIAELEGSRLFPDGSWYFGSEARDHGILFRLEYAPERSPFKLFHLGTPLFTLVDHLLRKERNKTIFRALLGESLSLLSGNDYAGYIKMPFKYAKYFDGSFYQRVHTHDTLFSALDQAGITYNPFIKRPFTKLVQRFRKRYNRITDQHQLFLKKLKTTNTDLLIESLCRIDNICHEFGPESAEAHTYVKKIDAFCREVNRYLAAQERPYTLIILSDHGLTPVTSSYSIYEPLKTSGLVEGKNYIMFVDSIAVRFWPRDAMTRKKLMDCLNDIECGHVLTNSECEKFELPTVEEMGPRFGDPMFIADNHVLLKPNYWQGDSFNRGMHGYLDKNDRNLNGFFTATGSDETTSIVRTRGSKADIAPSVLKTFDIDQPNSMSGKNLIRTV